MRTIYTRFDKYTTRTKQICCNCHYTYEIEMDSTPGVLEETVCLGPSDNGSLPFIKLLDKQLFEDEHGKIQTVNLYVCPRCLTVQLDEAEIDY